MYIDPLSTKLLSGAGRNGIISLMYHSITPGKTRPDWQWALSFQSFCEQLDVLQDNGWTTVSARQLAAGNGKLPAKTVLLTFDDGYADNFPAFEELARRRMTATWFVVTKDLGQMSSWIDDDAPSCQLLTASQLAEMHASGMEIGSHTHTHCRLPELAAKQIDEELNRSKDYLSQLLNGPVTSFAYPYGLYDRQVLSATKSAGYQTAFATRSGFGVVNDNLLEIRRVAVMAGDSLSVFARKLTFADNDVSWPKMKSYVADRLKARLGVS